MNKKSTFRSIANNHLTNLGKDVGITLIAAVLQISIINCTNEKNIIIKKKGKKE